MPCRAAAAWAAGAAGVGTCGRMDVRHSHTASAPPDVAVGL